MRGGSVGAGPHESPTQPSPSGRGSSDCACAARRRVRTTVERGDPADTWSAGDPGRAGQRAQGRVPGLEGPDSGRAEVRALASPRVQRTAGRAGGRPGRARCVPAAGQRRVPGGRPGSVAGAFACQARPCTSRRGEWAQSRDAPLVTGPEPEPRAVGRGWRPGPAGPRQQPDG